MGESMRYTLQGKVKQKDGSDLDVSHVTKEDAPHEITALIAGFAADNPGTPITFTVTAEGERFTQPKLTA